MIENSRDTAFREISPDRSRPRQPTGRRPCRRSGTNAGWKSLAGATNRTPSSGPRSSPGGSAPLDRQLHNVAPRESIENKCPTPIAHSNPLGRRAILTSSSQCLPRPAVRRSARLRAGSLNNRIALPLIVALTRSVSSFVRPVRSPLPGPVAAGSALLPLAGFRWLLYVK